MIDTLHYISQSSKNGSHIVAIEQALKAGCKWIQLRVKGQPHAVILEYAKQAVQLCKIHGAILIVDDHPEIAAEANAHGVHLGLQDMPVREARRIVGNKMIIGGTANTFEDILQRAEEEVDYIGCGPFRYTATKQNLSPFIGISGYEKIVNQMQLAKIHIPVIAIGGILPEDIAAIRQTGIYGVAISGAITFAENQQETVNHIYRLLNRTTPENVC